MNTIGYFEIQSSDPKREINFYSQVFGWKFQRDENVPVEYYRIESAGLNGGLLLRPAKTPGDQFGTNAFCCSVQVSEFDMIAKKILENGGRVAMPKFAVPGNAGRDILLTPITIHLEFFRSIPTQHNHLILSD